MNKIEDLKSYRIKEYKGEFTIQVYVFEPIKWFRVKQSKWHDCDFYGNAMNNGRVVFGKLPSFNTLQEALNKIKEFDPNPEPRIKYHYPE